MFGSCAVGSCTTERWNEERNLDPDDLIARHELIDDLVVKVRSKCTTLSRMGFRGIDSLFSDHHLTVAKRGDAGFQKRSGRASAHHRAPKAVRKRSDQFVVHLLEIISIARRIVDADDEK
jgi:hypothetical protein